MNLRMIAVDKNIEFSLREQTEWQKHGIDTLRVDTMQEAILELGRNAFFLIAINADNVHYLPLLKTMRDTTTSYIFIITSSFDVLDQKRALANGADAYQWVQHTSEMNVTSVKSMVERFNEMIHTKEPVSMPKTVIYNKFFILPETQRAFWNDVQLTLTPKQYELLSYFIANHNRPLAYKQIYSSVWGGKYDETTHSVLWDNVYRLRKNITKITRGDGYIENIHNYGYYFISRNDAH